MNLYKGVLIVLSLSLLCFVFGCEAQVSFEVIPQQTDNEASAFEEQIQSPSPERAEEHTAASSYTPLPAQTSMWGAKFPDKFTDGRVIKKQGLYMSEHVNITVHKVQEQGLTYYFADIYITDLEYFISPFSDEGFNTGQRRFVYDIARQTEAVIAVNGDYCANNAGPVIRDGVFYRNEVMCDILVMFKDGTMQTLSKEQYSEESIEAMKNDVWQIWTFGPMLLEDGQPMEQFDFSKNVEAINPRTAIGYFEPGHYAFVTVDGRQPGYSDGIDMLGLSRLMYELGCRVAFNLDGGGTAQMAFMGEEINSPSVHRKTRDALCIVDGPPSEILY